MNDLSIYTSDVAAENHAKKEVFFTSEFTTEDNREFQITVKYVCEKIDGNWDTEPENIKGLYIIDYNTTIEADISDEADQYKYFEWLGIDIDQALEAAYDNAVYSYHLDL